VKSTVDNLAPAKSGHLVVEGKRIKAGRTVCLAEATIFDSKGKSLAFGTSKQLVTPGLQTISQAVAAMGYQALPPKFITTV
jgi:acyl-coenzyme A thioesterase PaaI-like protein